MKNSSIHEKIEALVVSKMTTRNLGFIERHGDSCAESFNKRKKVTEKKMAESAFLDIVNIFHLFRVIVRI